ncbi:serine kinase [Thalassococcus profundi]|uniref:Serine kinase n=1 Tax=Thalassococcus profundi TaxID=2282382 RepID=A0A369THN5_9RHOB|nr:phosphotransferase [Thalassococcus profundi]RDD64740.1 serine kinase [Thalassococcus profundi]
MTTLPDLRHVSGSLPDGWFRAALAPLGERPEHGGPDRPAAFLARHYGIAAEIVPLASEVERTDEVRTTSDRRLILKTSSRLEARESFAFQAGVLAGLEPDATVIAPRLIPTQGGSAMFHDGETCGYLQTRLDGTPLHDAAQTAATVFGTGQSLARLSLALSLCNPPGARRAVLWHVGCWPELSALSRHLEPGPLSDLVRRAMADHAEQVAPHLGALDWQITHNDLSPHNMLLTDSGTGFIDFGDGGWNPRLQDLAIAAGHMVTDSGQPLGGAEALIAGYASVIPLSALDRRVLVGLMRARQAALVLINAWRSHLFPDQAAYINKNIARAERGLAILSRLDTRDAQSAIETALVSPLPAPNQEDAS